MHDNNNTPAAFIARWQGVGGSERANYQLFVTELCRLLDVPEPGPAQGDTRDNGYVVERRIVGVPPSASCETPHENQETT